MCYMAGWLSRLMVENVERSFRCLNQEPHLTYVFEFNRRVNILHIICAWSLAFLHLLSLIRSFTHSLIHSLFVRGHLPSCTCFHSFAHSLIRSFTHYLCVVTCLLALAFTHSRIVISCNTIAAPTRIYKHSSSTCQSIFNAKLNISGLEMYKWSYIETHNHATHISHFQHA